MILVDFNQVCIACMMSQLKGHTNAQITSGMFKHMVLNSIRKINVKFRNQYGELVICSDFPPYWRKQIFPYYKVGRIEQQKKSEIDWGQIHEYLDEAREDLRENFPYRVMRVPGAEADDVIATLTKKFSPTEEIMIVSGDKDFGQLHSDRVHQYDSVRDVSIKQERPLEFLRTHVLKGDSSDGIPNVLSNSDCFVTKTRQSPVTSRRLTEWLIAWNSGTEALFACGLDPLKVERNQNLIDLSKIPSSVEESILSEFEKTTKRDRSKIWAYMTKEKMVLLKETISDF